MDRQKTEDKEKSRAPESQDDGFFFFLLGSLESV
jgi:hypothetical protein